MKLLVIGSGMMGSAAAYERDVPPEAFLDEIKRRGIKIDYRME
jgi:predicted HTH domain antitoxin